ncbi:TMV resistance protein N-like [Neltuma alba]|uniref:TMV resistance protein N-like n=1 Tax=Neltuma alba TaxID=207710 RepID=UPI0010A45D42|nr:TMV resistance protein N-like [Prosopis alba]
MENLQFKSSQLSMKAPICSLKRRATASLPNEPPNKVPEKGRMGNKHNWRAISSIPCFGKEKNRASCHIHGDSSGFTSKTKYRYDVFLGFRGEDTCHAFTVPLYNSLRRKGINAFIDDKKLGKGERIAPAVIKAIERSRISLIVFSTNYATSTWCLEELTHIIWCKKQKNQLVMAIFYKVDLLDVQYQRNSFEEARAALEDRYRDDLEKVCKWRSALFEAASLSSTWLFEDGCESGFVERIVEHAYSMLPPKRFHNVDCIVGLEPRIEEVISLINKSDKGVCMLGIHGTGGIGKTTLAKALYYSVFYHFEGACFLFDVREVSKTYQGVV